MVDHREIIRHLQSKRIPFVLTGMHGMSSWIGRIRATNDVDILVKGKGTHLGDPAPPLAAPVTVQLMRGDGAACWEAVFTRPVVNDQGRFNARCD